MAICVSLASRSGALRLALVALIAGVAPFEVIQAQVVPNENLTRIDQDGADNEADITQSGLGNIAGTEDLRMFQDGFFNELTINQTGQGNQIGTTGQAVLQRNSVVSVDGVNTAILEQIGDRNRIDEVEQQILGTVPGAGNRLHIRQLGGDDNVIARVRQNQNAGVPGQMADIEMDGFGNRIDLIEQNSRSDLRSEENSLLVLIRGNNNGTTALRGVSQLPLVVESTLRQITGSEDTGSNANSINLQILGSDTAFGIAQRGRGNSTGPIVITGDGTSIGIDQDGLDNDLSVSLIEGDDNEIGISQYGTNVAFLSLLGASNRNEVLIDQMGTNDATIRIEGDLNLISARQQYLAGLGGVNEATFRVEGDGNAADLLQEGKNTFSLTIEGDFNNIGTAAFSAPNAPVGMAPGQYTQIGESNDFVGEIIGDRNLSAFFQSGTANLFSLQVVGDDNESILRQIGANNSAALSQRGRGNVAVIFQ